MFSSDARSIARLAKKESAERASDLCICGRFRVQLWKVLRVLSLSNNSSTKSNYYEKQDRYAEGESRIAKRGNIR